MRFIICFVAIVCLFSSPGNASLLEFTDDFEAATLDPFWTLHVLSGSHSVVPSTENPFEGLQSAKFTTVQVSGEKQVALLHDFATPIFGDVSVRVFDTGADLPSNNYIYLILNNSEEDLTAAIGVFDYDLGPTNGGNHYFSPWVSTVNSPQPTNSGIDRTMDWHEWKILSRPNLLQIEIDGQVAFSSTSLGQRFDQIGLWMFGPQFRPASMAYFDNFNVTQVAAVPEPLSFVVWGVLIAATVLASGARRLERDFA